MPATHENIKNSDKKKKPLMTTLGLEPRISRSVVGCLIQLGQAAMLRVRVCLAYKFHHISDSVRILSVRIRACEPSVAVFLWWPLGYLVFGSIR